MTTEETPEKEYEVVDSEGAIVDQKLSEQALTDKLNALIEEAVNKAVLAGKLDRGRKIVATINADGTVSVCNDKNPDFTSLDPDVAPLPTDSYELPDLYKGTEDSVADSEFHQKHLENRWGF
jgi:hypothetical protein